MYGGFSSGKEKTPGRKNCLLSALDQDKTWLEMSGSVRFGQTDRFQIAVWIEAGKEGKNHLSRRRHAALQSTKKHFLLSFI